MIDDILSHIAPHLCCGCGKLGTLLCDDCKYNIMESHFDACIACGGLAGARGICGDCRVPYSRGWCVGERTGELRKLIDRYKFEYARAAYRPLSDLLLEHIDQLPPATVVVPVPTIASHVRQRGYDHMYLIARRFARKRKLQIQPLVQRATTTKQRDADRLRRIAQAKQAFRVIRKLDQATPYLLIDDITTTGSTLMYAARAMREAGASEVWVATIARATPRLAVPHLLK